MSPITLDQTDPMLASRRSAFHRPPVLIRAEVRAMTRDAGQSLRGYGRETVVQTGNLCLAGKCDLRGRSGLRPRIAEVPTDLLTCLVNSSALSSRPHQEDWCDGLLLTHGYHNAFLYYPCFIRVSSVFHPWLNPPTFFPFGSSFPAQRAPQMRPDLISSSLTLRVGMRSRRTPDLSRNHPPWQQRPPVALDDIRPREVFFAPRLGVGRLAV